MVQNGYSVQYGRQAGANVNYVTKSGTNGIHGDLLYNFNNHLMNANDFFSNATGTPGPTQFRSSGEPTSAVRLSRTIVLVRGRKASITHSPPAAL